TASIGEVQNTNDFAKNGRHIAGEETVAWVAAERPHHQLGHVDVGDEDKVNPGPVVADGEAVDRIRIGHSDIRDVDLGEVVGVGAQIHEQVGAGDILQGEGFKAVDTAAPHV